MPPKRKRTNTDAQSAASSSRPTRSSGRLGDAAKSTANKSKKNTKNPAAQNKLEERSESISESEEPLPKKGKTTKLTEAPIPLKRALPPVKCSRYSRTSMERLFATYADAENPSVIGAEGLENLCADAKIPMEGGQPLLLAWLLGASELGTFKKEEWLTGLDLLQIDTLGKLSFALAEYDILLISDTPAQPYSSNKKKSMEPYNRDFSFWSCAADVPKAYTKFYNFVFLLAKSPQERNIDVEIAKAFWTVLLSEKYPIINDLIEYINEKGTVKGVNKDLWVMTFDFCKTFNHSLDGFETDGAWPTLLDEFYAWKKAKQDTTMDDSVEN